MDAIFPTHTHIWYGATKFRDWVGLQSRSFSGKRRSIVQYHITEFHLPIGHLTDDEAKLVAGFCDYVQGTHQSFYLVDPFHKVEDLVVGYGDGIENSFQLYRDFDGLYREYPVFPSGILGGYGFGGWISDDCQGYGIPEQYDHEVYIADVLQTSGYGLSTDGYLVFITPPPIDAEIKITYPFVYLVHFKEVPEANLFMYRGHKTQLIIESEP